MRFQPQLKLVQHKEFLEYLEGKNIVPINIEISPSGICNASCPWCFYGNNKTTEKLDTNILLNFLKDCTDLGVKAITWTGGGEPTLHPDFSKIIKNQTMDQGLLTNALNIPTYNPSILSWIRVSKTNKDWNKNSLEILRQCKTLGLCINYIDNEQEIEESLKIVYDLNLDYLQVRPALNIKGALTNIKIPKIRDKKLIITDYKFIEARKHHNYKTCEGFHFVPFLWEDGNLDTCAYKRNNKAYNLGNIYKNNFNSILKNFPDKVLVEEDCQVCCKNHEINMLINTSRKIEDKNFV